jgi:hypothetical protein
LRYERDVHAPRRAAARSSLLALLTIAACDNWPLSQNLSGQDPGNPSEVDPGTLIVPDWQQAALDEAFEPTPWPVDTKTSWLFDDHLEGVGWNLHGDAFGVNGESCGSLGYFAPPGVDGAYTGDVDLITLDVDVAGWLCLSADTRGDTDIGWDILLFPVDACDVPGNPIEADGTLVGLGREGPVDLLVPVSGGRRYVLMVAGFRDLADADGNSELVVPYRVGVTLFGGETAPYACPLLPEAEVVP